MRANQDAHGSLSPSRYRIDGARSWYMQHPVLSWSVLFSAVFLAAGVFISRHAWYPVLDLAMTEFRVRDVGTSHTPLVGLPGRIGNFPDQGSHPGPLSFFALAIVYKLSGSSAHGLEYATVLLSLAAVITALWLATRRGGPAMGSAVAAALAVVLWRYGPLLVTQPWNPYLPLLPWFVVLLAAWSVLDRDPVGWLPFAFFGALCAQTHIPYVGLVGGVGLLMISVTAARALRESGSHLKELRWLCGASLLFVVLWIPPIVDQISGHQNISMIINYFRTPPEAAVGVGSGLRVLLGHFDLLHWARQGSYSNLVTAGTDSSKGSVFIGFIVFSGWAASAIVALRLRLTRVLPLHAVVGSAIVLGAISLSRVFGVLWYYLSLWMVSIVVLAVFVELWTLYAALIERRVDADALTRWSSRAVLATAFGSLLLFTIASTQVEPPEATLSDPLGVIVNRVDKSLKDGVAGVNKSDRFVLTWNDAHYIGSQGYGLVSELERRGWDVGVPDAWRVPVTRQRVVPIDSATRELRFASGNYLRALIASDESGVELLARYDPRSRAQRVTYRSDRSELLTSLQSRGEVEIANQVDSSLFTASLAASLTQREKNLIAEMLHLGQPLGVLLVPIGYRR
ncbi:MAG: hypothetical protein WCO36_00025 [Actinomycetes bacterium]